MKRCVLFVFAGVLAAGQQNTRTVHYDGMGQPMPGSVASTVKTSSGSATVEVRESVNGGRVPSERVEEKVLREDGRGRVVERLIRRYDLNGNPLAPEKVVVEEEKLGAGSTRVRTTVYRGDMNGNLAFAERTVAETATAGGTTKTTETVDRPSINGGMELTERRSTEIRTAGDAQTRNTVIYRKSDNGGLVEAVRQSAESKKGDGGTIETEATYEAGMGGFKLVGQTVKRAVKAADGTEQIVVDLYTVNNPGVAPASADAKPQLRQQNVISRKPTGTGVVESVQVRRATLNDNRLGPPVRVSETVCTGTCK